MPTPYQNLRATARKLRTIAQQHGMPRRGQRLFLQVSAVSPEGDRRHLGWSNVTSNRLDAFQRGLRDADLHHSLFGFSEYEFTLVVTRGNKADSFGDNVTAYMQALRMEA